MNRLEEILMKYNEELEAEAPNKNTLDELEEEAKQAQREAKLAAKCAAYARFDSFENPMLEAAKVGEFTYEGFAFDKESGAMVPAIRVATISATDYTGHLCKLATNKTKNTNYVNTGIFQNGHKWEYMAEKLALLLAYRAAKELGASDEDVKALLATYPVREAAKAEKDGATPTSNAQLLKLLQPIIDAMVFVDRGDGNNAVKAIGKDVKFLVDCFTAHGKGIGSVKLLKGTKVCDYVFEIVHMIVNNKAYEIQYKTKKS